MPLIPVEPAVGRCEVVVYTHLQWEFAPVNRSADKIKFLAGPELMGGAYLTDAAPEDAAGRLRRAIG